MQNKIAGVVIESSKNTTKVGYCSALRKYHEFIGLWFVSDTGHNYLTAYIGIYDKKGVKVGF